MNKKDVANLLNNTKDKAKNVTIKVANSVVDTAEKTKAKVVDVANKAVDDIKAKKFEKSNEYQTSMLEAKSSLIETFAMNFIDLLGDSPVELTKSKAQKIKKVFPMPKEQTILWADAEFDLRPSGIVCTEKGVFVKSDTSIFVSKKSKKKDTDNNQQTLLFFYSWDDFEPSWFASEDKNDNKALLISDKCTGKFVEVCKSISVEVSSDKLVADFGIEEDVVDEFSVNVAPATVAGMMSSESSVFVADKSSVNTTSGHGEMAEEAITILDKLCGLDAKVVGRDNKKDGPDRLIGDTGFIQTKYYNSAKGSLEACFKPNGGEYRYINEITGKPMQLEVPKDQYETVLKGFRKKIEQGKVPGVTDPKDAELYVRKGRLTYNQAVKLTKPGTIESLSYDALTGVVTCSCAFGITFVATVFLTWKKTNNLSEAVHTGVSAGIQVFGVSFLQHIVVSQVARTGVAKLLIVPSQAVVSKLGYSTSAFIVNGLRALSGKTAIHGIAATNQLAKILRTNVLTSAITFAAFSIPETYNLVSNKISSSQYLKNITVLAGSMIGGGGGALAAGIAAAKVAGAAGTAVSPGVGTVVGLAGGLVGGAVVAKATDTIGDILHEDDSEIIGRLFNVYVSCLASEYLLDEKEIELLVSKLDKTPQKNFKKLFQDILVSENQEQTIRGFLEPHFDSIVNDRKKFELPSEVQIVSIITEEVDE